MSLCQAKPEQKATPPNVLFIAIDDLRTELNCYGASHIKSPNIDRLAESGVLFNKAHVQQAICMASRASMLSGIRPEKNAIYTWQSVQKLIPDALTMNRFFKQNGYDIASCGKIYHHGIDTKKQFGSDEMEPEKTWEGFGYVTEEAIAQQALNTRTGRGPAYEAADVPDTLYRDGINTLNAINQLAEFKKGDKPFFLAVGLTKPHLPFCAPQKYWDMYPEDSIQFSDLQEAPKNANKFTIRESGELGHYYGMPKLYSDLDEETTRTLRRGYYACISYADAQVGLLLDRLQELALRDNTIVVLWGDHGYKLGDYNAWCKWSNMTLDTRVPLIFSIPDGLRGETSEQVVESLDIYPTLADLCGLQGPSHLQGQSLRPWLQNPALELPTKQYAYTLWPERHLDYDKTVMGYSVKDSRFNYVEWVKLSSGKVLARELYDQFSDPLETNNVIADSSYANDITRLAKQIQIRKDETDHESALEMTSKLK